MMIVFYSDKGLILGIYTAMMDVLLLTVNKFSYLLHKLFMLPAIIIGSNRVKSVFI